MKDEPDNHIDELDEILHDLAEALESLDEEPDSGKWAENGIEYIDEAKRQIEDFYRNKILEELKELKPDTYLLGCRKHWSDDSGGVCTCSENESVAKQYYEQAIKDITAQFNSKGEE